ncbi:MAG: tetratricopeptide repeat protein [Pleomorphochaeta sp.]
MSNNDNLNNEDKVIESRLSTFLNNNSKIIGILAIVIVVVVVAIGIINATMNKRALANFDALDSAQTAYSTVISNQESETYDTDLVQAVSQIEELQSISGYVGNKATYLLAINEYNNENYQAALDYFLEVKENAKNTYLGSLSLSNAAVCAEQLNQETKVIEYCQELIDTYSNDAAETPRAMFTLARIYESQGNLDLAQGQFQQLADQFPNSEYGKLATNSLLNY